MELDFHVSLPDGSRAMAYDPASRRAMKSVRGIFVGAFRVGTLAFPAYGSIEIRPIIHASALKVPAVHSYSACTLGGRPHRDATIRPSTEGTMWQMT
jgi:hypothetical protein